MNTRTIAISAVCLFSVAAGCPAFPAANTGQPLTVNIKRLSLDTAMRIGKAAIDKCRKEGVSVTVTVIDRGGAPASRVARYAGDGCLDTDQPEESLHRDGIQFTDFRNG